MIPRISSAHAGPPHARAAAPAAPGSAVTFRPIDFVRRRLPNGLDVVVHTDRSTPVVAVDLWYHVGSKDETPDATGFAHFFEHLMFQGSRHYPVDYIAALQELGAEVNGGTTYDRTGYHEVVPAGSLELALAMESDRMGHLLEALSDAKLRTQKDVVVNEYRQQYLNRPYGMTWQWIAETAYPAGHPYSWMTIGLPEHVQSSTRGQVEDFFRTWYTPDNAALVIAGDVGTAEAFDLAEKWFGPIPAGDGLHGFRRPKPAVPQPSAPPAGVVVKRDRVSLPRVHLVWHTIPALGDGDAELDVLADILSHGKTSRLYKSLVYDRQIAQGVSADHWSRELGGLFYIAVTGKPGGDPAELRAAVDAELDRLRTAPPTEDEMTRAWNRREAGAVFSAQSVHGKAERLNLYNLLTGDPGWFESDLARYRRVTAADVQAVLLKFLPADRRLEMHVLPPA